MRSFEDIKRDELARLFPSHDIWTVRHATCRHVTWCSRPKGTPVATINANSADELQAEIAQELAEAQRDAGGNAVPIDPDRWIP
jgi:hypothetical protein